MLFLSRISTTIRSTWILGLLLVALVPCAQAAEPVAVVSVRATDALLSDVEYLFEATGTAGIGQFLLPQAKQFLQGIDGQKPIGLVLSIDNGQPKPLGFLPVTNLKTVLTQLQPQLGLPEDEGNGVLKLQGTRPIFVKEQDGWAFIGESAEALQDLPADPRQGPTSARPTLSLSY